MGKKLVYILYIGLVLFSCKKDKVPTPVVCSGVSMTGDRELFVGTWRWYNTIVEEWFDIGPSNWLSYNPQNQGFEYYFTISSDGIFKGYRNGILEEEIILSDVSFESFNGPQSEVMSFNTNCTSAIVAFNHWTSNITNDTIISEYYPFNFDDQENHLESKLNYFVKE